MLFTDKVRITRMKRDETFNSAIELGTTDTSAYIENNTAISYSSTGQAYVPEYLIFLPADTIITLQDTIEIINLHGSEPIGDEIGEKQIKKVKRVGGVRISHLEVFV